MAMEPARTRFEQSDEYRDNGDARLAGAVAQTNTAVLIDRRASRVESVERILEQLRITVVGKAASRERALELVGERNPKVLIEVEEATPDDSVAWLRTAHRYAPDLTTIAISSSDESARVVARPRRVPAPAEAGVRRLDGALAERITAKAASRTTQPTVSVVIPARNEAENLPHVLARLDPTLHEVILVDGASEDGTLEVARRLYPRVRTMTQAGSGKGEALRTGFAAATGDIVVMLDADGSTDPAEIPAFVGALCGGADFAKGSRFLQGAGTADMSLHRRLGNGVFVLLVRLFYGGRYSDLCYGYNAFWRDVLPALDLNSDGFEIETLMNIRALKARLKVVEVASFERRRIFGVSNLKTFADGWKVLKTILRELLTPGVGSREQSLGEIPDGLVGVTLEP